MPNIEPFQKYTDEYDRWFDQNKDIYDVELKLLQSLFPLFPYKGLEVGVGTGRFGSKLKIKMGIEPTEKMAEKARQRGIEVYTGVAENLPFSDETFDVVLMMTTICFVDNIALAFQEAFRILKPQGSIIIGFIDKNSELGQQYSKTKTESEFYQDATFFSTEEVVEHLEKCGFKSSKIKQAIIPEMPIHTILDHFGKGSFVAIKGIK